jgi:hypothetical protein
MTRQGYDLQLTLRRGRLARDLLHDRDGAFTDERDRHRMGAHAVARDAAGGVGGAEEGRGGQLMMRLGRASLLVALYYLPLASPFP